MKSRCISGHYVILLAVLLACLAVPAWAADGAGDSKGAGGASLEAAASLRASEEILERSAAFFESPPFMPAEEVYAEVAKGGGKGVFLVSLQSRAEFAKGHLPGAVNIPFDEITQRNSLESLPKDRSVVLTCDDGHRSMMASLYLNQLGYRATAMPMGLGHWNRAASAAPFTGSAGYPASAERVDAAPGNGLPALAVKGAKGEELVSERTGAALAPGRKLFVDPAEIYESASHGSEFFLVSIQRPEDYAKGHVPGAVNIPFPELTDKESLGKLPKDQKIVVICYIGHIGAAATLLLNQLGYEAYDLRYGTLGWNDATEGLGKMKGFFHSLTKDMNYPVERGTPHPNHVPPLEGEGA